MIGYAYLDIDANICIRDKAYIDEYDPGFWGRNSYLIDTVWTFDTEDEASMDTIMNAFKRLQLPMRSVQEFCIGAGFNLQEFLKRKRAPDSGVKEATSF